MTMQALYNVVAKVFRQKSELDLLVPAFSAGHAVAKVRRLLNDGRLFVCNDRVVPKPTKEQPNATEVVRIRSRIEGYLEHAEAFLVHHRAYHPARWVDTDKGGKFVHTPPRPYYNGRRGFQMPASTPANWLPGDEWLKNRTTSTPAPVATAPTVNTNPEGTDSPAPVFPPSECLAHDHAREDFSPRCKSHAAKLKARLKSHKDAIGDAATYAEEYAHEWARLSTLASEKPKKVKAIKKNAKATNAKADAAA